MTPDSSAPLRIVIADDQTSVRDALAVMLDLIDGIEVVGTAADGQRTLELVAELSPGAVLLDLHMPGLDGIETTRRLRRNDPELGIVVLSTYSDDDSVRGAMTAGATGYLTKNAGRTDIARALFGAARGQSVIGGDVRPIFVHGLANSLPPRSPTRVLPAGLTPREAEVLILIANGYSNGEIAGTLFLSPHTVKTHINRIFGKTGAKDRGQAVIFAQQHELVSPPQARPDH